LLFAVFMISDPMTAPNRAATRYAYAVIVAVGPFVWQFWLFKPHGLIWALFLAAPLLLLFDRIWLDDKHEWRPRHQSTSGRPA
jgi:Na+-translocating ferredoxin:NAD+ oxidoreductase RnfD subunit